MSQSTYYCLKNPQTSLKNPDRGEVREVELVETP